MTPDPPSHSDNPALPPRHRPALGDLAKDTTEADLWDLEDDLSLPDDQTLPASEPPRPGTRDIPAPREKRGPRKSAADESGSPLPPAQSGERIQLNVSKGRQNKPSAGPENPRSKADLLLDELDDWQSPQHPEAAELDELPPAPIGEPNVPSSPPPPSASEVAETPAPPQAAEPEPIPQEPTTPPQPQENPPDDEFSPRPPAHAQPVSLRPKLTLTKVERWSLIGLATALIVLAAVVFSLTVLRLPSESERAQTTDFPIQGKHLAVSSATSYWRLPITDGPQADTVRRGTELLPVLELSVSGGPAAIRVLFRNEDRSVIGDAVTRTINSSGTFTIPATAGFDDIGMHAAYRTGRSKPWTIEVFEAPSSGSAGRDFKRLFELNISADRR